MRANGISNAQAGTQIVRVLDAIEHQKEGGFFQGIEHIVQRDMARLAGDFGNHPLMARATAGHAFEPLGIHRNHLDGMQFGVTHQVSNAGVVPLGVDEDFKDGIGLVTQLGDDGVKTVDETDL